MLRALDQLSEQARAFEVNASKASVTFSCHMQRMKPSTRPCTALKEVKVGLSEIYS